MEASPWAGVVVGEDVALEGGEEAVETVAAGEETEDAAEAETEEDDGRTEEYTRTPRISKYAWRPPARVSLLMLHRHASRCIACVPLCAASPRGQSPG